MTTFKKIILSATSLVLVTSFAACSQDAATVETATVKSDAGVSTPAQSSTPEVTPTSAAAADPQNDPQSHSAEGDHSGHDHDSEMPDTSAIDIDHVFDFAPDDHLVGSNSAPVKMITYASVTCGHCAGWFTTEWPILKKDYIDTGKVQMAFREIPTPPQQLAVAGFVVANCAPEEKYMDIIVHQMQNQAAMFEALQAGKGQEVLNGWAKMAGLNSETEINACFQDKAHIDRLNRSGLRMTKAGLRGVPSIIINGEAFTDQDKSISNMKPTFDKFLK